MKEYSTPKFWCSSSRTARRKAPKVVLTISWGSLEESREEIVDSIAEVLKGELDSLLSLKAFQEFSFSAFEDVPM
jgi:hypothetical protein